MAKAKKNKLVDDAMNLVEPPPEEAPKEEAPKAKRGRKAKEDAPEEPPPVVVDTTDVGDETHRDELVISDELSTQITLRAATEAERDLEAKSFAKKLKGIQARIDALNEEYIAAACRVEIDHETGVAKYVHKRSGEIIRTRPIASEDVQERLPFPKSGGLPEDGSFLRITRDGERALYQVIGVGTDTISLQGAETTINATHAEFLGWSQERLPSLGLASGQWWMVDGKRVQIEQTGEIKPHIAAKVLVRDGDKNRKVVYGQFYDATMECPALPDVDSRVTIDERVYVVVKANATEVVLEPEDDRTSCVTLAPDQYWARNPIGANK